MTRTVRAEAVTVELGRGWWRGRWSCGAVAGPFTVTSAHDDGGAPRRADGGAGSWHVEIGACDDRPGSWARWKPAGDGPGFAVHVPAEGPVLVVEAGHPGAAGDGAVFVLVDSPGDSPADSGESADSPGDSPAPVVVARGGTAGAEWAALAAGPEAARLVSEARR